MSRFGNLLHQGRYFLLAAAVSVNLLLAPKAFFLVMDPSNLSLLQEDQAMKDHRNFVNHFGSDDSIIVAVEKQDVFSQPILEWLDQFISELSQNPKIDSIESIFKVPHLNKSGFGIETILAYSLWKTGRLSAAEWNKMLRDQPDLAETFLSRGGSMMLAEIRLKSGLTSEERHEAVTTVQTLVLKTPVDAKIHLSGSAAEQDAFIHAIQKDHERFVPLTLIVILLLTLFFSGHWAAAFYPLAVIISTVTTTQAFMSLTGQKLNPMTLILTPTLITVSIAEAVHFQSHAGQLSSSLTSADRVAKTLRALFIPCFFTSATTAAGFSSLLANPIPAVRTFGLDGAVGVTAAFLWTLILAPFFLEITSWWAPRISPLSLKFWESVSHRWVEWIVRFRKGIVLFMLLTGAAAAWSALHLEMTTDILKTFHRGHAFRTATESIQKHFPGIFPLELMIQTPPKAMENQDTFQKLVDFKTSSGKISGIKHVRSVLDLFLLVTRVLQGNQAPGQSPSDFRLQRYADAIAEKQPDLKHFFTPRFEFLRWTYLMRSSNTRDVMRAAANIQSQAAMLGTEWRVIPAGQMYLLAKMSQDLVAGFIQSNLWALATIGIMMALFLRSFKLGLFSLISNLWPTVILFGLMPLLHITLSTATATIGCLALGLMVDNAIHLLYHFGDRHQILSKECLRTIPPLGISSLVLAGGFSICMIGSTQATVHFGLLMFAAIMLGYIANVVILIALLNLFPEKKTYA